MLIKHNLYWGYIDYNEEIHVKKYKDDAAIRNAQDSGTTIGIFDPFEANSLIEATNMILDRWRDEIVFMKKDVN